MFFCFPHVVGLQEPFNKLPVRLGTPLSRYDTDDNTKKKNLHAGHQILQDIPGASTHLSERRCHVFNYGDVTVRRRGLACQSNRNNHCPVERPNPRLNSSACKIDPLQSRLKPRGHRDEVSGRCLADAKTSSLQLRLKPSALPVFERPSARRAANERARLMDDNEQTFSPRPLFCPRRDPLIVLRKGSRGKWRAPTLPVYWASKWPRRITASEA